MGILVITNAAIGLIVSIISHLQEQNSLSSILPFGKIKASEEVLHFIVSGAVECGI